MQKGFQFFIQSFVFLFTWVFVSNLQAATFRVSPNGDPDCSDSICSFQAALDAATQNNEDNTLQLSAGIFSVAENGGKEFKYIPPATVSGPFNVGRPFPGNEHSLTILGAGAASTFIEGLNTGAAPSGGLSVDTRLLNSDKTVKITIKNVTLQNGINYDGGGGARVVVKDASVLIENCVFRNNGTSNFGLGVYGGGLYIYKIRSPNPGGEITLLRNTFMENGADQGGGASIFTSGGRVYVTLSRNFYMLNSAEFGGGALLSLEGAVLQLVNNIFTKNSADNVGGALYLVLEDVKKSGIFHNTITGNTSRFCGGLNLDLYPDYINAANPLRVVNNIIYGNQASDSSSSSGSAEDIRIIGAFSSGGPRPDGAAVQLSNNDFHGFYDYCERTGACSPQITRTNNLDVDPHFVDVVQNNFHLQSGSPLIHKGTDLSGDVETDFDGNSRRVASTPDPGAYEFRGCGDGVLNAAAGEECDDGNVANGDACNSQCKNEARGGSQGSGSGSNNNVSTGGGSGGCNMVAGAAKLSFVLPLLLSYVGLVIWRMRKSKK